MTVFHGGDKVVIIANTLSAVDIYYDKYNSYIGCTGEVIQQDDGGYYAVCMDGLDEDDLDYVLNWKVCELKLLND